MREEQEMYALLLSFARKDDRVRAVMLNGSRANPNVSKDRYQDYDIVYLVRDMDSFTADHSWIDIFGERLMLQMPETMRDPLGDGRFTYLMLLADGNRIDLTLIPAEKPALLGKDSLTVVLLDKDGILPGDLAGSDRDYWVAKPSELEFRSCCNNFWWCMQNVAKGIARNELPYAMRMYHTVVGEELMDMVRWYIGANHDFQVSPGKMGKFFARYLTPEEYQQYLSTYSAAEPGAMRRAMTAGADLFSVLARYVGETLGYGYAEEEEKGIRVYLKQLEG